ncbi:ABC transporter ATP-binding protein [Bacillus sp. es.036]|uniref:ABC transporter ATP-binding protein n=1 Tax=Bacillus sp. es.036 TaxID=1761764 RepID=UPI000BF9546C|nr:ABC transporter ATP-binding protein [Bacillus sp. es.036]PFG15024.1 ATP-binding cassette, subfamily B, MsbA [Bacillus sp. es.036]
MKSLAPVKRLLETGDIKGSLTFLSSYIKPYWRSYCCLLFILIVDVFLILLFAWLMQHITDSAVNGDFKELKTLFTVGLIALVVTGIVDYFDSYLRTYTVSHVKKDLRRQLFERFLSIPYASFEKNHSGKLLSHLTNDIDKIHGAVGGVLLNLVRLPILVTSIFVYLVLLNWQLSLLFIVLAPLTIISGIVFGKQMRDRNRLIHKQVEDMHITLNDSFAGNMVLRTFSLESLFLRRFQQSSDELLHSEMKEASIRSWFSTAANMAGTMSFFITLGLGAFLVTHGQITIGVLLAFVSLMQRLVYPLTSLAEQWGSFQRSIAAVERIMEAMHEKPEMNLKDHINPPVRMKRMIEFRNLDFHYQKNDELFQNFSLKVPAGKVTALVGPSGAGKSTLFHLLQRVYQPHSGNIFFDDLDVYAMSINQQRSYFSYVPQDTFLFSGTIEENIAFGRIGASRLEIIEAAKKANAHQFIVELKGGYDTEVGERGSRLSGGQKQRIAIARAILRDAPILLLDEATSALDNESERLVQEAIERLMEGRTTIMIAHRLSTIRNADHIVVINKGEVVEQGSHVELIQSGRMYANLYNNNGMRVAQ